MKFDWFKQQWEKEKEEIKAKYKVELEEKDLKVKKLAVSSSAEILGNQDIGVWEKDEYI